MGAGTRILIILFAAALVVLGMQPLSKGSNRLQNIISKYSEKISGKKIDFSGFSLPSEITFEVGEPNGTGPSKKAKAEKKEVNPFDELSRRDRDELSNLLNKLSK